MKLEIIKNDFAYNLQAEMTTKRKLVICKIKTKTDGGNYTSENSIAYIILLK